MKNAQVVSIICLTLFGVVSTTLAKDKKDQSRRTAQISDLSRSGPRAEAKWAFSDEERRIVQNYALNCGGNGHRRGKHLPPGLSKKIARGGRLPPGWQQKCVVGEIMPAAVYDQCHALPPEVVVRMPPSPEPTLTVTIGGKVVRLLKATREILDVFDVDLKF